MNGFLLDTNVISELVKPRPEPKVATWVEATDELLLYLSVLTLGEIRKGIAGLADSSRRAAIEVWLAKSLRPRFLRRILPIGEEIADRWGVISARSSGKGRPVPVIDGLLAATAIHHNLTLVTRNTSNLAGTGVPVFSPWES